MPAEPPSTALVLRRYPLPPFENGSFPVCETGNRMRFRLSEGGVQMGDRTQRVKGKAEELKGKTKANAGRSSGKTSTEAKGVGEVAKGKANQAAGKARSAAKKATR